MSNNSTLHVLADSIALSRACNPDHPLLSAGTARQAYDSLGALVHGALDRIQCRVSDIECCLVGSTALGTECVAPGKPRDIDIFVKLPNTELARITKMIQVSSRQPLSLNGALSAGRANNFKLRLKSNNLYITDWHWSYGEPVTPERPMAQLRYIDPVGGDTKVDVTFVTHEVFGQTWKGYRRAQRRIVDGTATKLARHLEMRSAARFLSESEPYSEGWLLGQALKLRAYHLLGIFTLGHYDAQMCYKEDYSTKFLGFPVMASVRSYGTADWDKAVDERFESLG